ncbi:B3 domain-containing transcription factor VRN1 [Trifolium repens]|nr:B3 domain-containing transcription factor VRN1 [Trifolium repens]
MIDQLKQEPEFVEMSDDEIHIASASQRRKRGIKRGVTDRSFEIKLTPSYTGYLFRIQIEFSRRYLKDFEGTARVRKIGDEDKIWEMEVKYDIQCGRDYSVVNSGWKPFVNEYNLQIGDVWLACIDEGFVTLFVIWYFDDFWLFIVLDMLGVLLIFYF